jgi:ATP-binding cassette subfamily F protein 3
MLNATNLAIRRGPNQLFHGASFTLHRGNKVGITGANGTGKSSLFALIRGELQADEGELSLPPNLVIAHVAQETPASDRSALDYVLDGDGELRALQAALVEAEARGDGARLAHLHADLEHIGAYTAESRAARLLHGLGFQPEQYRAAVQTFSGGWRMRLNLAQALMCRSDLLLLDEPTNHLDLDAVLWLEEWLQRYPGTLLLISHDRDFLDRVVDRIAHIEREGIDLYTGNYSAFEVRRAEKLAQQQAAHEKQQRERAHIQSYVDRFRAQATKARQAQSRIKALERMEDIAEAHVDSPFHFSFRAPRKLPNPLLRLEGAAVGYGDQPLLSGINLGLAPGARIGLLGPNGAGKSTLIKLLAGELAPRAGKRIPAQDLDIGYFAQHQLEQLDPQATPLQHLLRLDPRAGDQDLRNFLGGFGFNGDRAVDAVAPFSGGEKARLVLALLVYQRPNLLLLDEPTNHLDLEMRLALSLALQEYQGAMVIVSHDRHLLRSVTDQFHIVHQGGLEAFDGDLEDYRQYLAAREAAEEAGSTEPAPEHSAVARKDRRRDEAERRKRLQPLRKELQKRETELERLSDAKARLDEQLADAGLYEEGQKERLKALLLEQAGLERKLAETEEAWLAAGEALETAEQED